VKFLAHILIGSLALIQVYEVPGEQIKVGEDKQVEAAITVEDNMVRGYVEDPDPTRFFPTRRKVTGEWKSNGVIEVEDKYGYKYNLKPTGKKMIGERRTYNYDYRVRKQGSKHKW
jgi:hypothetical protein